MITWIVGKLTNVGTNSWEFQGAFSTEALAVAACRNAQYFIAPATVDAEISDTSSPWVGGRYPLA